MKLPTDLLRLNFLIERSKAEQISRTMDDTRKQLVRTIQAVKRMRKLAASSKAMTLASLQMELDTLIAFHELFKDRARIGGY